MFQRSGRVFWYLAPTIYMEKPVGSRLRQTMSKIQVMKDGKFHREQRLSFAEISPIYQKLTNGY